MVLTALEFRLLAQLLVRLGRVQTREVLLETRTVATHVMRLRDALGPARALLETVRDVGYRLVAPDAA